MVPPCGAAGDGAARRRPWRPWRLGRRGARAPQRPQRIPDPSSPALALLGERYFCFFGTRNQCFSPSSAMCAQIYSLLLLLRQHYPNVVFKICFFEFEKFHSGEVGSQFKLAFPFAIFSTFFILLLVFCGESRGSEISRCDLFEKLCRGEWNDKGEMLTSWVDLLRKGRRKAERQTRKDDTSCGRRQAQQSEIEKYTTRRCSLLIARKTTEKRKIPQPRSRFNRDCSARGKAQVVKLLCA